jgi:signal transduction histidine kinase
MQAFFDLSFRTKIPIWGGILIVLTVLATSASLFARTYDDLKQGMLASADSLGQSLASSLFTKLLHEDVWAAYELIAAPLRGAASRNAMHVETLLVVNTRGQIVVSTQPEHLPMLGELRKLGGDYARVAARLHSADLNSTRALDVSGAHQFYFAVPIASKDLQLGTLILVYSRSKFMESILQSAWRAGFMGLLILAVLLPLNVYWGRRMAIPLLQLTAHMERLGTRQLPDDIDPALYPYRDELGKLFDAYRLTLGELREKALLEKEIVRSERLAAVGQLTASIAHEINNPLAGMLTAINTLKHHGECNARMLKTVALIERGLVQIKDSVAALLIEARVNTRNFTPQDLEDIRTLLQPEAQKKQLKIEYRGQLGAEVPLPATLLRQVFMNLLLNAVQAANQSGVVWCEIEVAGNELRFEVGNDGCQITEAQRDHIFEPFMTYRESGHGLGLWVTYQIMQKLGGRIIVAGDDGITRFGVHIPLGAKIEQTLLPHLPD